MHRLEKGLLLRKPGFGMREIAPDSKTMLDIRVQEHLVRNSMLLENVFSLTTLFSREDFIRLCVRLLISVLIIDSVFILVQRLGK